jgi:Xaa-Pro aminopeptidase
MADMRNMTAALLTLVATSVFADLTVPATEFAARRARVAQALGRDGMLVLRSADAGRRNGDVEYPFRQDDNLRYLTGIAAADATLVLLPGEKEFSEVLFVRERNPQTELWTGRISTHDEVKAQSGIKHVANSARLDSFLSAALQGLPWSPVMTPGTPGPVGAATPDFSEAVFRGDATLWFVFETRPSLGAELPRTLEYANKLRARYPEVKIRDARNVLVGLRQVKSDAEVATLRRAIDITAEAQKAAMRRSLTAKNEREIHAVIEGTFLERGACCWGFPSIVAAGPNATTLHYESNDADFSRGDLILTDLGADYEGYTADITRTYPSDGTFSPEQRAIYTAVYRAQEAVFGAIKPGVLWRDLQNLATDTLGADLLRLGLITKNDPQQVRMYFRHGLGHPIGMQVHDVQRGGRPLEAGMVMAVEPGIYVRKDDVLASPAYKALTPDDQKSIAAALDRYANIGVRIEDDVLVTRNGYELLSANVPRSMEAIEALMATR